MPPGIIIDCTDIEGCSCYCDSSAEVQIKSRMAAVLPEGADGVHFIDSGDYHYITKFWTDRIREPFNLILFDHHPDMQNPEFPGFLSCGGWVRTVMDNPYSRKILIAGSTPDLAKEALMAAGRVWLIDERHITNDALAVAMPFFDLGLPVYVSIDKDVLDTEWARTDWDQGTMTLQMLESWIRQIFEKVRVIGVDICGESPGIAEELSDDWEVNSHTNMELFAYICLLFKSQGNE
ncbi:MAG: arginase family protein [Bacteroidales bacterium]|nr:arginase family protein [Bacteroidales bacterium]MDY6001726.1 arginase family protein [Candidatus Cryptobacteroides sp.]